MYIYIQVFAVRQWPGNELDLDFNNVINKTNALMAIIHADESLRNLNQELCDYGEESIPIQHRSMIGFYRIWCLAELGAARNYEKSIIFRVGTSKVINSDIGNGVEECSTMYQFVNDVDILDKLKVTLGYYCLCFSMKYACAKSVPPPFLPPPFFFFFIRFSFLFLNTYISTLLIVAVRKLPLNLTE